MVIGAPFAGGCMLTGSTCRACCTGTAFSGALGCADTPGGLVILVGDATSCVIFSCPWGDGVVVTDTVSGTIPCEPGIGEIIFLGFELSLFGGVSD